MSILYPKKVTKIAVELLKIIEQEYPGITKHKFDNLGFQDAEGSHAQQRAEMCIYIELMKAGVREW